jgi:hypothetical protein
VVQDLRITNGNLLIAAPNVTVRRVEIIGGRISNSSGRQCWNGLVIENTTIRRGAGTNAADPPAVEPGGYTARNVELDGVPEGFRVGGRSTGCGAVTIENSYVRIQRPDNCGDWHGDGVQGYDGNSVRVRNLTIVFQENGCGGTAPFFYPHSQGNTSVDIDGLLVQGGGFPFRLGMPGSVRNLNIVRSSWGYGPIDVKCSVLSAWSANTVTLDGGGQPVDKRAQPCNTESGG